MNYNIDRYILDAEGKPVLEPDRDKWAASGCIGKSIKVTVLGGVTISTIFLALDYNHWDHGNPILWETMIFGGIWDKAQRRAATREEALAHHHECVMKVFQGLPWWRRVLARILGEVSL